jgi:hypothetical protein
VLDSGKELGIYHYAREIGYEGSAWEEAMFFLSRFRPYIGKAIPCLDWEANALDLPIAWAKEWMDIVAAETGATPFFYSGAGYVNGTDCSSITDRPLWKASYLSRYSGEGFQEDPVDVWGSGDWDSTKIYQYTSEGFIAGYGGPLDLNFFYGSKNDWERFCGRTARQEPGEPVNDFGLQYHVHAQNLGDLPTVHDGQVAGTTGFALRMEAITFDAIPENWSISAKAHLQGIGWVDYGTVEVGKPIGTVGESRRIEMLELDAVKPEGDSRKLHFEVHQQNNGWLGETPEGYASGCDGQEMRLEAFRAWVA